MNNCEYTTSCDKKEEKCIVCYEAKGCGCKKDDKYECKDNACGFVDNGKGPKCVKHSYIDDITQYFDCYENSNLTKNGICCTCGERSDFWPAFSMPRCRVCECDCDCD